MRHLISVVIPFLLAFSGHAQTPVPASTPAPSSTPTAVATPDPSLSTKAPATPKPSSKGLASIIYRPQPGLMSGTRRDGTGGTRGSGVKLPSLFVLAPEGTALTAQAQPSLFWYQSGPASVPMVLTVTEVHTKNPKPLLKVGLDKAAEAGIHRLSLARYKEAVLAPGVLYQWNVALVPDQKNRSQDVIASGTIQRTDPNAELAAALAAAEGPDKAALYAGRGYWYDALQVITDAINATPKDNTLQSQRARLLESAGLKIAATSDRK